MLGSIRIIPAVVLAWFPAAAFACPICLPPQGGAPAILEQIAAAGALVLANPQADPRAMKVSAVFKGKAAAGDTFTVAYVDMPRTPFDAGKAVLLSRHPLMNTWRPLGALPREREAWLRAIMGLRPTGELAPGEWPARVKLFADDLFADDPFVSQIAADQIARAPYAAMRTLHGSLDGEKLVGAAHRIETISRLPLLILLMGVSGDGASREFVTRRLTRARTLASPDELAALITARIEMDGEDALQGTGRRLLASEDLRPDEVNGALMALDVVGGADHSRRTSIVAIYRDVLRQRPETAGYVARSLEDWRDWSLAADIVDASSSARIDEGSKLLIRSYLDAASNAKAAAILN